MDDNDRADLDLGVIESMTIGELNAAADENHRNGMRRAIMQLRTAREHLAQAAVTLEWLGCKGSAREVRAADSGIETIITPLDR